MRLCLVSNLYPPHVIGGAETIVREIARAVRADGHEVDVVTTARRGEARTEIVDGVTVHRFAPANLYWAGDAPRTTQALKPLWHAIDLWNPVMYRAVRQLFARGKFDVVHTHNLGGLSPAVWSAAAAARVPVVHTTHDYALTCVRSLRMTPAGRICESPCPSCALRGAWLRRMSRRVTAVAAPSTFVLDRHRELGFFPNAAPLSITPWGLAELPLRRTRPPASPPVRFLYLGLLRAHKGVRVMLDAFTRVPSEDARLDIAGAGELLRACQAAAAADRRITVHGYVSGEPKARLLAESHAMLVPSISWEVSGLVILEAFAYGMPVIASRIGGIPEVMRDGVTGFLIDAGNPEELAARMRTLVAAPETLAPFGDRCRARAEELRLSATVARLLDLYRSVSHG